MKRPLAFNILDRKLQKLARLVEIQRPEGGWIREIRRALGMTREQLAEKIDVSITRVFKMEQDEMSLKLSTMQKIADALDFNFVYALVPKTSLEKMKYNQAREKARKMLKDINHNMSLEDQGIFNKALLDTITEELLNDKTSKLWKKDE